MSGQICGFVYLIFGQMILSIIKVLQMFNCFILGKFLYEWLWMDILILRTSAAFAK